MAKLLGAGVLIVWVDLDPNIEEDADRWYAEEHLPERITEAGYLRARRYEAVSGTPAYMSVFEAATPDALASDGYRRITASISPLSKRIRAGFTRCIRSTHRVVASLGTATGGTVLCTRIEFDKCEQREAFAEWARSLATWAKSREDVLAAHALERVPEVRARMDSFRATGQQDDWADGVLLLEFARPQAAHQLEAALSVEGLAEEGLRVHATATSIYRPLVEFSAQSFRLNSK